MKKSTSFKLVVVAAVALVGGQLALSAISGKKDAPAANPIEKNAAEISLHETKTSKTELAPREAPRPDGAKRQAKQNTKNGKTHSGKRIITVFNVMDNPWYTGKMEDIIANQWAMDKTACVMKRSDALGVYQDEYAPVPMRFCDKER